MAQPGSSIVKLGILLSMFLGWGESAAIALPGQSVSQVQEWIRTHPLLLPADSETLRVQKNETAARWFTFEASVLPPGRAQLTGMEQVIRSEELAFFDVVTGISRDRLIEIFQAIYDDELFQDFERSRLFYTYPTPEQEAMYVAAAAAATPSPDAEASPLEESDSTPISNQPEDVPTDSPDAEPETPEPTAPPVFPVEGEIRVGSRYAYWIELTRNPDGVSYNGRLTIFLVEDLDHLLTTLMANPLRPELLPSP